MNHDKLAKVGVIGVVLIWIVSLLASLGFTALMIWLIIEAIQWLSRN